MPAAFSFGFLFLPFQPLLMGCRMWRAAIPIAIGIAGAQHETPQQPEQQLNNEPDDDSPSFKVLVWLNCDLMYFGSTFYFCLANDAGADKADMFAGAKNFKNILMKIISYNVNGIRAAIKKGFIDWLATNPADIICLQETKATKDDIDREALNKLGYEDYWFSAEKKGYSGVAIFTKIAPDKVSYGTGIANSDAEGRVIQATFGDIELINAYFPSGTSGDERQNFKMGWLDDFFKYLQKLRKKNPRLILCGDYNIAHTEVDIHDPKGNKKSSGFLPEERQWLDNFFANGWVDSFRKFHPEPHRYSWWSQRFPSVRLNNKGWRIDYINATDALSDRLIDAEIYPDVKHSDHCPVWLEIKHK